MTAIKVNGTLDLQNASRQDFYDLIEGSTPDTDMADGETLEVAADKVQAKAAVPRWEKVTVGYATIKALGAVTSGAVTLLTLQDGGVVHACKAMSKVQFAGGTISALVGTVGITGTVNKYLTTYNMWAAPATDNFGFASTVGAESQTVAGGGAGTAIKLTVTSTTDNLDALTAGSIDVWVLWSATV